MYVYMYIYIYVYIYIYICVCVSDLCVYMQSHHKIKHTNFMIPDEGGDSLLNRGFLGITLGML